MPKASCSVLKRLERPEKRGKYDPTGYAITCNFDYSDTKDLADRRDLIKSRLLSYGEPKGKADNGDAFEVPGGIIITLGTRNHEDHLYLSVYPRGIKPDFP
jgi:hypothetical protein